MLRTLLLCALLSTTPVWADDRPHVDFSSEVNREVSNDLLVAQLSADTHDRSATQVASQLTGILNICLRKAEAFPSVNISSGNQSTFPVYGKNNQLSGWRGHGELRLETHDFKAAGQLIAQLQESIQLSGVSFTLAPETRERVKNEMIAEAMVEFRKRAKVVAEAMNAREYKVQHLAIDDGGNGGAFPMLARSAADLSMPTPDFVAGTTQLSIRISGTIEIY